MQEPGRGGEPGRSCQDNGPQETLWCFEHLVKQPPHLFPPILMNPYARRGQP
jgi:hypothetical protein